MTTAFQSSAFQDDAYQIDSVASTTAISGGGYFTPERFFTPILPKRERERIDGVIERELKLRVSIEEYTTQGLDTGVLDDLLNQLRELQILILKLALESDAAYVYIQLKRQQEDDDIAFIMSML